MNILNTQRIQKIYAFILILFCAIFPITPLLTAPIIIAYALFWLIEGNFQSKFGLLKTEKFRKWLIAPALFYLMHIVGMIYTENLKYGLFDLETKLPLFIFPLLFSTAPKELFSSKNIHKYLFGFILGCLIYALYTISYSTYEYLTKAETTTNVFFGTLLSRHVHPSYAALFSSISFAFCIYLCLNAAKAYRVGLLIAAIFLFCYTIILASKSGLISLGISFTFSIIYFFRQAKISKQKRRITAILGIIIIAGCLYGIKNLPFVSSRIEEVFLSMNNTETSRSSTGIRIKLWRVASDLVPQYFWIGTGTGDINDIFIKEYHRRGIETLMNNKLNPHSQFFQTLLALGICGLLLLTVFLVAAPIYVGLKNKYPLLLLFAAIAVVNCLVESILERQAGILFFTFFYCFFIMHSFCLQQKNSKINQKSQ